MRFTKAMTLFTRTPLHVGAGNSVGAIDSPIIRERHTNVPLIPGSSLKGVLVDLWTKTDSDGKFVRSQEAKTLFGDDSQNEFCAGELLVGEARVLAFPIRSAKNAFAWIVSPMTLQRFSRDFGRKLPAIDGLDEKSCLAPQDVCLQGNQVVLEEYLFTKKNSVPPAVIDSLKDLSEEEIWKDTIASRLVVVSDEIFSYFCKNACEVTTRIQIDDNTRSVAKGALFSQELLPSETMLTTTIGELRGLADDAIGKVEAKVKEAGNILQIGGDATIGLGFCSVRFITL